MDGFYFDQDGLIVQRDGDGGDTLNRHGILRCAQHWLNLDGEIEYQMAMIKLEIYRGSRDSFVRHPHQPKWSHTNGPDSPTRDQMIPNEIAIGFSSEYQWIIGQRDRLGRIVLSKFKRVSTYQSGDLSAPHHWAVDVRSFGAWYLYPFLYFSDLFLILETLFVVAWAGREPGKIRKLLGKYFYGFVRQYKNGGGEFGLDCVDPDLNLFLMLRQAHERFPTLFSWLASCLYVDYRRPNMGEYISDDAHPILQAWLWYFRPETGACNFGGLYTPIIKDFVEDFSWKKRFWLLTMEQLGIIRQVIVPLLSFGLVRGVTR